MTEFYARCTAQTAKGKQCAREVTKVGDVLCTQHASQPPQRIDEKCSVVTYCRCGVRLIHPHEIARYRKARGR